MHYGWLPDSIWYLVRDKWEFFDKIPYVLVTCIDSSRDMKSEATKIVESEKSCSFLGSSLLIGDTKIVYIEQKYKLFDHFDEIWLFEDRPAIDKPSGIDIVSPLELNKTAPSKELLDWFSTSGCVLGLGDGIGMNYITTSEEIVQSLNAHQQVYD